MHVLCKPKTFPVSKTKQLATRYCRLEIIFVVMTVYVFLLASPSSQVSDLSCLLLLTDAERTYLPRPL